MNKVQINETLPKLTTIQRIASTGSLAATAKTAANPMNMNTSGIIDLTFGVNLPKSSSGWSNRARSRLKFRSIPKLHGFFSSSRNLWVGELGVTRVLDPDTGSLVTIIDFFGLSRLNVLAYRCKWEEGNGSELLGDPASVTGLYNRDENDPNM